MSRRELTSFLRTGMSNIRGPQVIVPRRERGRAQVGLRHNYPEQQVDTLTSTQRKQLRSLAHHLNPVVLIGKNGITETVVQSADQALEAHELIKVRFVERKDEKREMIEELASRSGCHIAGVVGHTAILYRQQRDPAKRRIELGE